MGMYKAIARRSSAEAGSSGELASLELGSGFRPKLDDLRHLRDLARLEFGEHR
jgi:hypothetical protein